MNPFKAHSFYALKKQGYYYCDIWSKVVYNMFNLVRQSLVGVQQYKASQTEFERDAGNSQNTFNSMRNKKKKN